MLAITDKRNAIKKQNNCFFSLKRFSQFLIDLEKQKKKKKKLSKDKQKTPSIKTIVML